SQALRADKQYYPAVMAKSRVLSKIGKHDEAESLLQPLLKNGGRIRGLFTVYGCVLAAAKRVSEALTYFQKATKNFPNDPQAWRFKGQALLELNRPHQALTSFGRAMRIAPGDFRIGVRYCKALFTLRQHERALQTLPVA